ncbi:hypothetical protein F511_43589 [Dorcoceras hygrometricum]|uniref:Uncharacterized protein n=1 Tax=Dorcoceras hygrometricum TaxID=472368 RepID=A0A2Z7BU67_9LAMI|nr:hypothetical protein F511_43589 [Dorcoceras hygrometricum]
MNLTYIIKGESNKKAHMELGILYRGFATSSGVARAPALLRGVNSMRKGSKIGVSSEDPDPTIRGRYDFPCLHNKIPEDHGVSRPHEISAELIISLALSRVSSDLSIGGASSDTLPAPSDELFVVTGIEVKRSPDPSFPTCPSSLTWWC